MHNIDMIPYTTLLNEYIFELINNDRTHYCDMLVIDLEDIVTFRPLYYKHCDIAKYLNIDNGTWVKNSDILDTLVLTEIIDHCLNTNVISYKGIKTVMSDISSNISDKHCIRSWYDLSEDYCNDDLLDYFMRIKSTLSKSVSYQTRSYINGSSLKMYITELPPMFYVYNNSQVYLNTETAVITASFRFYRKM